MNCDSCIGAKRVYCDRNYMQTRQALDDGVDGTMGSNWKEVGTNEDGTYILTSLGPDSEAAMTAHAILRNIFLDILARKQAELGCELETVDIEKKLITTQGI